MKKQATSDELVRRVRDWMIEAESSETSDANAAALATANKEGQPQVRMVLVKAVDAQGLVFYTNLHSRKGRDLEENPRACLNFHWKSLARQLRQTGTVEPVGDEEADSYFASRDRLSQLGAWASDQSQPLKNRALLLARLGKAMGKYPLRVPRPPHWSGFRLVPLEMEFWQGEEGRIHRREVYVREGARENNWRGFLRYP